MQLPANWFYPLKTSIVVLATLIVMTCCAPRHASAGAPPLAVLPVATGLARPIFVTAPDGDYQRLFIVEQGGTIRILDLLTGTVNRNPFLDINALVVNISFPSDERGLLGLAFDPDYANNGTFYVHYNDNASDTILARYTASVADPNIANVVGEIVLSIEQPAANNNGGWIGFGPDGYLYMALGDGGIDDSAQSLTPGEKLGKMLRIDVNGPGSTYNIPADNPFVGTTGDDELWAYGLRNPWRCSFDRETGDFWIGDVGQNVREEVNVQPAGSPGGENYGWNCMEGSSCTGLLGCTCNGAALSLPIHEYDDGPDGCAVVAGYVYRGLAMPDLRGTYFFGDYCSSMIWSFERGGSGVVNFTERTDELEPPGLATIANNNLASFGEDAYGEIYIVDRGFGNNGEIYKIVPAHIAELDCNNNAIVDSIEIQLGLAPNGIPDDCVPRFSRGDCNNDGQNTLSDAIHLLNYLFIASATPSCQSACDFSDNGALNIIDALGYLSYLFAGSPAPAAPFPTCGTDPTVDPLTCDTYDVMGNCP